MWLLGGQVSVTCLFRQNFVVSTKQHYYVKKKVQQYTVFLELSKLMLYIDIILGVRGSVVVKALCYKPEGRRFDTR
jgi:hypothetical protein